jgi:hypothetical protein
MYKNHGIKAMPQFKQLVASFPLWHPRFDPKSHHVEFVVNKVALGQIFSENFGFPCSTAIFSVF